MADIYLWQDDKKINTTFDKHPDGFIKKLINIKNNVFILSTIGEIFHSTVDSDNPSSVAFKIINFTGDDIACNSKDLFIVNPDGFVLKINPSNFDIIEKIVLKNNPKHCSHGCTQDDEIKRVKSIAVNDKSELFVTENGELWARGCCPQIDVNCSEAKKVIFFDGRIISGISCGDNFWVAIARKIPEVSNDETDDETDCEKIYINTCPKCVNEVLSSNSYEEYSPEIKSDKKQLANPLPDEKSTINNFIPTSSDKNQLIIIPENNSNEIIEPLNTNEPILNGLFTNSSMTKNFITRQLSRVSSHGDEICDNNYEETTNPSKLLRQNVSNVANFLSEGVKTISDKVTNLSRHMTGVENEKTKLQLNDVNKSPSRYESSRQNSIKNDDLLCSCSTSSSFDQQEISQHVDEQITALIDAGNNLLSTELWAWGESSYGQLGTGDHIARPKPILLTKLQNTAVQKVKCGPHHTLTLTLDGRVFSWGRNNLNQVRNDTHLDQSSPKLINPTKKTNSDVRASDISVGERFSLMIVEEEIYFIGKTNNQDNVIKLDLTDSISPKKIKYLSSSGSFTISSLTDQSITTINSRYLNNEKFLLEEMIIVSQCFIKQFQKKSSATRELNAYEKLCNLYLELLALTALDVLSLEDYTNNKKKLTEIFSISEADEFTNVYKYYINALCDVISLDGFSKMSKIMPDLPENLKKLYFPIDSGRKITSEEIITQLLQSPLDKLNNYPALILDLLNNNKSNSEILQKSKLKWERLCSNQKKYRDEAIATRNFWEQFGKSIELQKPERRLIRESRLYPLSIMNYSRFTSHWFILLNDVFIHTTGTSTHTVYPLSTIWIEAIVDTDTLKNALSMTTPEKNLLFYTTTPIEKNEWLLAFQSAIKKNIPKFIGKIPPRDRTVSYTFTKHPVFKDAVYTGRWSNGKPHGFGEIKWRDGKIYVGQFYNGSIHGSGKIDIPLKGCYDGEWVDGRQCGFGRYQYDNCDVYDGWFKDDLPHGHGVKQEGSLMTEIASLYIGEWSAGLKHGYGVKDDQMTGEKYLGSWHNDLKHGTGVIVTLDGTYYEGEFVNGVMTGHGLMVFDDGTHYEGEIKSAGSFGGKGVLELQNGYTIEGNIHGNWNDGVKLTATLHLNKKNENKNSTTKPPSFSKIGVPASQKWKSIFRQCYELLGLTDPANRASMSFDKSPDTQRIWENLAVVINKSVQKSTIDTTTGLSLKHRDKDSSIIDGLSKIPDFGRDDLTPESYELIKNYLTGAFDCLHHPLGWLLTEMASVFNASYGGVRVHPLLLTHAVDEIRSITERIYEIVNLFFPALPKYGLDMVLKNDNDETSIVRADSLLHPILLPQVNSALFVLYALHNKKEDDAYWERLVRWNRQNDQRLMELLDVDKKFWNKNQVLIAKNEEIYFNDAIENLQQLKTTFSPLEKLMVIRRTFEKVTKEVQKDFGSVYMWSMDELFPVINFVVIRAGVLQLGSEINLIEDFMESYVTNGELGIMFSTLKASYHQILYERIDMTD